MSKIVLQNKKYEVFPEDGAYVARCLDVEVASEGDTEDEAVANLQEALELYFDEGRDGEAQLIDRCVQIAIGATEGAADPREANVFRVAAMVIRQPYPKESERLMQASEAYFALYPDALLPVAEIVRRSWIFELSRLHDRLMRELKFTAKRPPYAACADCWEK